MQIKGSAVLVSGGASGLGEGTVRLLVAGGAQVMIADVQVEKGEALAKTLGCRFIKTDVTSESDGQAAVAAAVSAFGGLQGLVNCAGVGGAERTTGNDAADIACADQAQSFAGKLNTHEIILRPFASLRLCIRFWDLAS